MDKAIKVHELPVEEDQVFARAEVMGDVIAEFPAYVQSAVIAPGGEVSITIRVPFEDKYRAMPVTDFQGVMFDIEIRRKARRRKANWTDAESGDMGPASE